MTQTQDGGIATQGGNGWQYTWFRSVTQHLESQAEILDSRQHSLCNETAPPHLAVLKLTLKPRWSLTPRDPTASAC